MFKVVVFGGVIPWLCGEVSVVSVVVNVVVVFVEGNTIVSVGEVIGGNDVVNR